MGNTRDSEALREGAAQLGLELADGTLEGLLQFRDELLKWNQKFNLTSITDPQEVLEKHFLDSLAVIPELGAAGTVLDVGAGGGFPGIPLKLARPELHVTCVDTVGKKVVFMKNAIARLGIGGATRAVQVRVEGDPEREGLPRVDLAVSRAFMDVARWVPLAARYLNPGGRVLAMVGQLPDEASVAAATTGSGLKVLSSRSYALPWSGAGRAVLVFGA